MPKLSSFTGFGFLRCSSEPSEAEKIYKSMLGMYRDPADGRPTLDVSQGTYQEAKVFATSKAIAAAHVTVQSAGEELKPEASYYTLEKHEAEFKIRPYADATVVERRAVLEAKQKLFNGPRYEAMVGILESVIGEDNLIAYRPVATAEADVWPPVTVITPTTGKDGPWDGPGTFVRHDSVAKSIRLLGAVARCGARSFVADSYSESNKDGDASLGYLAQAIRVGQTFTGDGRRLRAARFFVKRHGSPVGRARVEIYTFDNSSAWYADPTPYLQATSEWIDVATIGSGVFALISWPFKGDARITLASAGSYAAIIAYEDPSCDNSNHLKVGHDSSSPAHAGKLVYEFSSGWTDDNSIDVCFYVDTDAPYNIEVAYENSNKNEADVLVVPGDVLAVDVGNLGLAEKVKVLSARKDGTTRKFTANFYKPHSAGTFATTGPAPTWLSTKRHVLVVTPSAVALDPQMVRKVDAELAKAMRGPTTWAVVQPTTPGASTTGPFKIGTTLGSPLGAVPLTSMPIDASDETPPASFSELFGDALKHLWDSYTTAPLGTDSVGGYHFNALYGAVGDAPTQGTINGHTFPQFADSVSKGLTRAANFTTLDSLTNWTMAAILKVNGGNVWGGILDKSLSFFFELASGTSSVHFSLQSGGCSITGVTPIGDNQWHTAIVTSNNGQVELYVDAALDGTDSGGTIPVAVNDLLFGVQPNNTVLDAGVAVAMIATKGLGAVEVGQLHSLLRAYVGL